MLSLSPLLFFSETGPPLCQPFPHEALTGSSQSPPTSHSARPPCPRARHPGGGLCVPSSPQSGPQRCHHRSQSLHGLGTVGGKAGEVRES